MTCEKMRLYALAAYTQCLAGLLQLELPALPATHWWEHGDLIALCKRLHAVNIHCERTRTTRVS